MQPSNVTIPRFKTLARLAVCLVLAGVMFAPVQNVFSAPHISIAHAQAAKTTSASAGGSASNDDIGCGFFSNYSICLSNIVYLFAVYIPTGLVYVAGYLFNFAIQLSLNSGSYALDFLSTGWAIVRDVANLSFIFILIYIAYTIIIDAETAGTMHMLAWVVAMALLINFSFFITRVAIDAGNILSVQFYNAIPTSAASVPSPLKLGGQQQYVKDLTGGVMDAVGLQRLLGSDSFKKFTNGNTGFSGFMKNLGGQVTIYLAVGVFLALLAFIFLIAGVRLIIRVVILWLVIIGSPIAFAAHAMPETGKAGRLRKYYGDWQNYLIESAFYPAIFLFLFYVLTLFLQQMAGSNGLLVSVFNSASNGTSQPDLFNLIADVGIRMGLVTTLLYLSMKVSDKFSETGATAARSAISWTGNKAASATGWAARQSIGRTFNAAGGVANKIPLVGTPVGAGLKKIGSMSYDARNYPRLGAVGLVPIANRLGLDFGTPSKGLDFKAEQASRKEKLETKVMNADMKRLGELEEYNVENTEKRLHELATAGRPLTDAEKAKFARLEAIVKKIESKEGVKFDSVKDKLKTEHALLADRAGKLSDKQLAVLDARNVEGIIKQISENQLRVIKESGKLNQLAMEKLINKWHEQSPKSPKNETHKALDAIGKLYDVPRMAQAMTAIDSLIPELRRYAKPSGEVTLSLAEAQGLKKKAGEYREEFEDVKDDRTQPPADRQAANQKAKALQRIEAQLNTIVERLKNVPKNGGGAEAAGTVERKA